MHVKAVKAYPYRDIAPSKALKSTTDASILEATMGQMDNGAAKEKEETEEEGLDRPRKYW